MDSTSVISDNSSVNKQRFLTFKPKNPAFMNLLKQSNVKQEDADQSREIDRDEQPKNKKSAENSWQVNAEESGSIASEMFKTIKIGPASELSKILRPQSNRSVVYLPREKRDEESSPNFEPTFIPPPTISGPFLFGEETILGAGYKTENVKESALDREQSEVDESEEKEHVRAPEKRPNKFKVWLTKLVSRSQVPAKGTKTKEYLVSFWLIWVWSVWALICTASMLCFVPWVDEASLWFPHYRLYLEKSASATWIDFFDEFLKVISYFATDLRGFSRKDYDPNIEFISNSAYSFDYSSWCRDIPMTASTTCYSGRGMDVISGIVTDLGVQIGVAGRMDNPIEFGANFAATFKSTVHDIDKIYKEVVGKAYVSAENSRLDINKLELVHKAALSIKLGEFVGPLKLVHASCMGIFSGFLITLFVTKKKPSTWRQAVTMTFLVCCEAITFATYTLETIYLSELNKAAYSYNVTLTPGLGSTLMIVEFMLGILLGVIYIAN